MTDPLEGFRGTPLALARRLETAKPDDTLWARLYLGEAAKRLMLGMATREDIGKVMAMMIAQCEISAQRSAQALIAMDDPGSEAARHEHFLARVEAAILGRMNQFVRDGIAAADEFNHSQE